MTDADSPAVLFVDDEEKSRKYFALGIQTVFPVLTADSVDQGIEILQREAGRIGVLVTDQRMPGKNGVEILRYARENHPAVVRLLTTAYSDLEDAVNAVNSGEIVRYIRKPWQLEELIQDVRQAMGYYRLGLERDQLLREKLALRQIDVLVQQVEDLVGLAATAWDTRRPLTAVRAFLDDAIGNGWLLPEAMPARNEFEEWRWIVTGLQRSLDLVERLAWLRRPDGGFTTRLDAQGLAALLMTHGSWRDDAGSIMEGGEVLVDRDMIVGMIDCLSATSRQSLPWLAGMLACRVTAAADADGLVVTIASAGPAPALVSASDQASAALDFYTALPLFGLYLTAWHHGGRCAIDHAARTIRLELPTDPARSNASDIGIDWLQDLLGELVLVVGEES